MMNSFDIDDLLERMASEGRRHFIPQYICKRLNYSVEMIPDVTEYLLSLAEKKLIPLFEVTCPEGDSDFIVENPLYLDDEPHICHYCGEEYIPDPDSIWLCFNFTKEYLEHGKKKALAEQQQQKETQAAITRMGSPQSVLV